MIIIIIIDMEEITREPIPLTWIPFANVSCDKLKELDFKAYMKGLILYDTEYNGDRRHIFLSYLYLKRDID